MIDVFDSRSSTAGFFAVKSFDAPTRIIVNANNPESKAIAAMKVGRPQR
jgi:hypothetical protein